MLSFPQLAALRLALFTALAASSASRAAPPQGQNDQLSGSINTAVDIKVADLLSNDSDADGDKLTIAFIDDMINGSARYDSDTGIITFSPLEDFVGQSQFTYTISDGYNGNDYSRYGFALVTIDVKDPSKGAALNAKTEHASNSAAAEDTIAKQARAKRRADNRAAIPSTELRTYFFGHSLIYHTHTKYPRTSELSVPYWMHRFSQAQGRRFLASGSFRTATYALPAIDGWGFTPNISAWQGDFTRSKFNAVVYTAINYVQYQSPSTPYHGGGPQDTPINFALRLLDYVRQQAPGVPFYLYESWPDAGAYAPHYDPPNGQNIDPSPEQVAKYYQYAQGEYHQWWLSLQDALIRARPDARIKLVPVGPIMSKVLSTASIGKLNQIPFRDLYEDNAPHGRPSIYFLAALIQHMAMYQTKAPTKLDIPTVIHPQIREHYSAIVSFIWRELRAFNALDGESRLW